MRFRPPFELEDGLELARDAIGPERADEAWRQGNQMSRSEAIALARSTSSSNDPARGR